MTITLRVKEVLRDPSRFVSGWRLAVEGVLLVTGEEFRIFQADESGPDEQLFLPIDDPLSAALIRTSLPQPPPGGWEYFGKGMVEAWTRHDPGGWVLHEVVTVWLEEMDGGRPVRIRSRPHPWGWDEFL